MKASVFVVASVAAAIVVALPASSTAATPLGSVAPKGGRPGAPTARLVRLKARFVSFDAQTRVLVVRRGAHTFTITVPAGFALPSLQANQKVVLMALLQGGQMTLVALKAQSVKPAPTAPVTQVVRFDARFVSFNAQTRTLTVTRGGLSIAIAVPATITLPALAANAKLQITAALQNGQLTLVAASAGRSEDDD